MENAQASQLIHVKYFPERNRLVITKNPIAVKKDLIISTIFAALGLACCRNIPVKEAAKVITKDTLAIFRGSRGGCS